MHHQHMQHHHMHHHHMHHHDMHDMHHHHCSLGSGKHSTMPQVQALSAFAYLLTCIASRLHHQVALVMLRFHSPRRSQMQPTRDLSPLACNPLCACLQQRYSQHEKKFAEANMRLTEEYKRITEHFKDLQAKFSHFQQADLNKYQAVSHNLL